MLGGPGPHPFPIQLPFNSLFEMLKYFGVVYVECFFGLSILYLRCAPRLAP